MNEKVTVVIPTYGDNTNPKRAVISVLNQDYSDIQVVVVDDNGEGSPQQRINKKRLSDFFQMSGLFTVLTQ